MLRLRGQSEERDFLGEVMARSGQNLLECLQCGKCSGSCPITSETVGGPRRLIAQILSGMREEALRDPTWWYCVSCGSCASRCPVEINTYEVSTALCEMAEEAGIKPSEPGIHLFEELFLKSVQENGRVQEIQAVLQYNLKSFRPWADATIGMKLMMRGALSPAAMIKSGHKDPKVGQIFRRINQIRQDK
jgi:heterodisulfide reductase subunit C